MIRTILTTPEGETQEGDERLMAVWQATPDSHIWDRYGRRVSTQ
jgi:magnesium transporter